MITERFGFIGVVEHIISKYKNVKLGWAKKSREMYLTWKNGSKENRLILEKVEEQQVEKRKLYWSLFLKGIQEKVLLNH
jgi:hypothetical protein